MKDIVLIKGNKYGLTIFIDEQVDFTLIKEALYNKLNDSRKFFGNSKVTLSFEGRNLSDEEQKELINVIQNASDLDIICVIDDSNLRIKNPKYAIAQISEPKVLLNKKDNIVNKTSQNIPENAAIFHKGTLRSGQEIVTESSIIIMGNVHYGASIVAKGNVIVIGKLNGCVHAGKDGNLSSFIVALNMNPTQMRIADVIGRSPDKKSKKTINTPQIAYVEDERIIIENINRNIYENLKFNYH